MKCSCPLCGHVYRWRPSEPCPHLLATRWVVVDYDRRQLITRHRWVLPAAIQADSAAWIEGVMREILRCGCVVPVDDLDAAAIADLRIGTSYRERPWNENIAREQIFLFANSNADEWLRQQITRLGAMQVNPRS